MGQKLQIMRMGEQIADLEDQITKWKEDYICLENLKDYELEQIKAENKKLKEELTEWNWKLKEIKEND